MPVFSGGRRVPARPVRPSFRDPRFAFLLAGQSVSWVGSWAAALVLWGFAAYKFGAGAEAISVTALCWSGPPVVLTAFTGGLTDRFGPRTMLIIGYTCSAATSLGMAEDCPPARHCPGQAIYGRVAEIAELAVAGLPYQ
jgi:hypothetical protein